MDTMMLVHELDGRAFTLPRARRARRLYVLQGRAWITERVPAARGEPVDDLWLAAGAVLDVPAGSRWIVQADGDLRLALRESVAPASQRLVFSRLWQHVAGWPAARPLLALVR